MKKIYQTLGILLIGCGLVQSYNYLLINYGDKLPLPFWITTAIIYLMFAVLKVSNFEMSISSQANSQIIKFLMNIFFVLTIVMPYWGNCELIILAFFFSFISILLAQVKP